MRICYFIQNHLAPPQAERLLRTLRRGQPDCFILVGHDGFAGHATAEEVARALDADVFALTEPARRGYFSLLQPYFDAVEWLARRGTAYDWLVYLSAQDYPVRPLPELAARLATADCDGFLRYWDACNPAGAWGHRRRQGQVRYFYQYRDAPSWLGPALRLARPLNRVQSLVHIHLSYGLRVGLRRGRRRRPFGAGLTCYAGLQWTTLSRACAEHVLERSRAEPRLMEWFRATICPDEAVVQTLLLNGGRFRLANDDLRYVDFSGSRDGRPRLLSASDLPHLTCGRYCFARKFERDSPVLDLLDACLA
jgi:hypothetical protein